MLQDLWCDDPNLGANHLTLVGGWVILKKNMLQADMRKKKIPAQDHRPKNNSCTYSGLEKKSGNMFPVLTREFLYQQPPDFPASRGLSRRGKIERMDFASSWETSASREPLDLGISIKEVFIAQ